MVAVPSGDEVLEECRPICRRHVRRLHLVLKKHGDAVQRTRDSGGSHGRVQGVGLFEGSLVEVLDRVEPRTRLVESFDTVDVPLHQRPTGNPPTLHRGVSVLDGGLEELEALRREGGWDRNSEGDRE